MKKTADFLQFYQGNQLFESLIEKYFKHFDSIQQSEKPKILTKLIDSYNHGLPYSKRPLFLFYFTKLLFYSDLGDINEEIKRIVYFFTTTIHGEEFIDYLMQLEHEQLFEVVQMRGDLYADVCNLTYFIIKKETTLSWEQAEEMADSYLDNEPCISIPFLEKYFHAYYTLYSKENIKFSTKKLVDLSNQILEYSKEKSMITLAWIAKNDDSILREYNKETLSEKDLLTLNNLTILDQQLIEEFGDYEEHTEFSSKFGKALVGLLSKERKEQRREQKEVQRKVIHEIKMTGRSNKTYLKGYISFLSSIVYLGTDDLKKGLKSLDDAYDLGFDPELLLSRICQLNVALKNKEKAAENAQELMNKLLFDSYEKARNNEFGLELIVVIEDAGNKPYFSDKIINDIIEKSDTRMKNYVAQLGGEVEPICKKIEQERIEKGIKLIDSLIDNTAIDKCISENSNIENLNYKSDIQNLIGLSLEELDLFIVKKGDYLFDLFSGTINAKKILNYTNLIRDEVIQDINGNLEKILISYPALSSNIVIASQYLENLISKNNLDGSIKLVRQLIDKRDIKRDIGILDLIRKVVDKINSENRFKESIELLRKGKNIFGEKELQDADLILKDTYFSYISFEKSPIKRDNILKEVESDNLHANDERFKKLRIQINNELNKRKKIIMMASGIVIVVIVIVIMFFVL